MKTRCGCRELPTPIEFEIKDDPQVYTDCEIILPNNSEINWFELKNSIICDFKEIIKLLECGILPDIEILLEEISLIFMNSCGYNITKKMYATDLEEDENYLRHNNFLSEFETQEEKNQVLINLGIYDKLKTVENE